MLHEIVDTHLHLWDPSRLRYSWLDDIPLLNKPYLLADYNEATKGHPVRQMVFVQCEVEPAHYLDELAWVEAFAREDSRIQGIVPWAPLEDGDGVAEVLDSFARNSLVKGVRRIIQFEADPAFCLQPDFVRGVTLLGERDLHFEICLKGNEQFRNCLEMVRRCPDVRFLLNHIGKPFIADGIVSPWSDMLQELAALPNTWCKVSGMANEADMDSWAASDLQLYVKCVLDSFGWDRVMFGGDWPVALLATTYDRWVTTLEALVRDLGADDQNVAALFAANARSFYKLPDSAAA